MPEHTYRFCPICSGALEPRLLKAGEPERLVCTQCGFVFYLDPKIAVGTIIRAAEGGIVLVRRAIEPGFGKWVFPGDTSIAARKSGPPQSGKRAKSAASTSPCRGSSTSTRTREKRRSSSSTLRPITGGTLCADDECLEARVFDPAEIPWDELAFRSTYEALRDYLNASS